MFCGEKQGKLPLKQTCCSSLINIYFLFKTSISYQEEFVFFLTTNQEEFVVPRGFAHIR